MLPDALESLTLTLTSRCNLACGYCWVPKATCADMSESVAVAAAEFLAASRQTRVTLSFFGGEPFLALAPMHAAIVAARGALGDRLRINCPTNGTVIDGESADLVRRHGIALAVSVDGVSGARSFAAGGDAQEAVERNMPVLRDLCPGGLTARITVVPSTVRDLARNIRALAALGFPRIAYQPAVEVEWDAAAVEAWAEEHRRIGTWLVGMRSLGRVAPSVAPWRRVEARLRGAPLRACGAGARIAAVRTDGAIVPCYRLAFVPDLPEVVLGRVQSGIDRPDLEAAWASLDPWSRRPKDGDCASCEASDGCTYWCPSMGLLKCGDPSAVPEVACRLVRAQVREIRRFGKAHDARRRPVRRVMRAAFATAAAATLAVGPGCYESEPVYRDADADVAETPDGDADGDVTIDVRPEADSEFDGTDDASDGWDDWEPGICGGIC